MNLIEKGAQSMKWTSAILALSLFITPTASFAQAAGSDETTIKTLPPQEMAASPATVADAGGGTTSGGSSLAFSPTETPAEDPTGGLKISQANEAPAPSANWSAPEPKAAPDSEPAAETANAESNATDGEALAQSTAGSKQKLVDPVYRKLPGTTGTVKIRRQFTLFAKEELIHNLSFRDSPVRTVIADIARRGNLNIIVDKSVVGRITGDLHDVTLNEAMDSTLAAAGLQTRVLDNNTVIVGTPSAMVQLGLNRPIARVFKLSYATPFDVANLLFTSVFNRGIIPDITSAYKSRTTTASMDSPKRQTTEQGQSEMRTTTESGAPKITKSTENSSQDKQQKDEEETAQEVQFNLRVDNSRQLRATERTQLQEGTGFNNAAQDPGSQQIRAYQSTPVDLAIEQNGGGAIVIPDSRNRQVIVVGTPEDVAVAEECIRLIDRRPKQIHVQVSLLELKNEGIRQLGAALNLQGEGTSAALLGGAGAPLVNFLPGLGSAGQTVTNTTVLAEADNFLLNPALQAFTRTFNQTSTLNPFSAVTGGGAVPSERFRGLVGQVLPVANLPSIAGLQPVASAASGFNFLTLDNRAGGRANIATLPTAANINVQLLLQTNKAKVLANPSVVVSDNTEALVTLANEVVHKVTSQVSLQAISTNVELVKAGVFLNVLPRASEDGFITMRLRPQVSTPLGAPLQFGGGATIVTLLNIREIMAQEVRVKDGQTLVLGGLFSEQEAAQMAKVPYLAETPLFGALFRNTLKGRNRTELMLMITPKIVEEEPERPAISENPPATSM